MKYAVAAFMFLVTPILNAAEWNVSFGGRNYVVYGEMTPNANSGDQISDIQIADASDSGRKFNVYADPTVSARQSFALVQDFCRQLGYKEWVETVFSWPAQAEVSALLSNDGHETLVSFDVPKAPLQPFRFLECTNKSAQK